MTESQDPLDNEVSVSLDIKETGVTAKSKSRLVSGLDRLLGNLTDWANVRLEGDIRSKRAVASANEKLTGALTDYAVEQLQADPEFAQRALAHHMESTLRSQNNRERVAKEALEDLRREPPTVEQATEGSETISPEILDRLESYASGASTQELQERWGRVFATEVRKPGTFSLKVLRVIDELDHDAARGFEHFAKHRVGTSVPKVLAGTLEYSLQIKLVDAGVLFDPGLGQAAHFSDIQINGMAMWTWKIEDELVCIPKSDFKSRSNSNEKQAVVAQAGQPAAPVYILTSAGFAITAILPPVKNSRTYFKRLKLEYPTATRWKIGGPAQGSLTSVSQLE